MTVVAVLIVVLFWGGLFMVVSATKGVSPLEFFLGRFEPVPSDLGCWKETDSGMPAGLLREERFLLPAGRAAAGHLLHQVRYRDPSTREIVSVEPERRVRRRRVNVRA